MALLSDTFTDLCAKHDLCSIDVGINNRVGFDIFYTSYAQWIRQDGERDGVQNIAETPELAMTGAIEKANAKRHDTPSIEALEVAA